LAPGDKIDEADLIANVLDVTQDEYQSVLTAVQSAKGLSLTLSDLEVVMQQHYRQLSRSKNHKSNKDMGEVLLGAFHGECFYCGKSGHWANQCPSRDEEEKGKKGNKPNKNIKRCINCGKTGHWAINCWHRESNKDKRPPGLKPITSKSEVGGAAEARSEILLGMTNYTDIN
jgi:Zinc knuckle